MSYIGNAPITAAFLVDTFSGTGSQTVFTMTVAPANTSSIIVAITGVLQDPSTYSVSGTTLTFSAAPPSGTSNISVRYLGIPASGVTTTAYRTVTNTTATAGQTSFTIPSYTVGYVDVYRNGVYLPTSDYTATTGTTVVLNNAATAGDTITTISFYVSSVLNAIPATAGAISLTSATYLSGILPVAYGGTGLSAGGPAFSAYASATQSVANATFTKVVFDVERFDTNNNFASSTFTPTVAGYYQVSHAMFLAGAASGNTFTYLYKNGTNYAQLTRIANSNAVNLLNSASCLVYCNGTTDYLEIYIYQSSGGTLTEGNGDPSGCWFTGAMVRSA